MAVRKLIVALDLPFEKALQLFADTVLVTNWYYAPERYARLKMDLSADLQCLVVASKHARSLTAEFGGRETNLEQLFEMLPPSSDAIEDFDMLGFASHVERFIRAADQVAVQASIGGGRYSHARRDTALALIAEAASEATGIEVATSSGNRKIDRPHFKPPAGPFVAGVMALLGHKDEHLLVEAARRTRRREKK